MTASEIADRELDIVAKYNIKMDMKKLTISYEDRGKKYKVQCFSKHGVKSMTSLMINKILGRIENEL